ncbi:electron transporter RnfD [Bifidobacterium lemurum]
MGRIDDADPTRPVWVHPYTQTSFRFTGTSLSMRLINHRNYGDNHIGVALDGFQTKARIPADDVEVTLTLAQGLPDIEHEVTVFKRQDGEHYIELLGFEADAGARVLAPADPAPSRRIEVYGDSVSCGERNEATRYVGEADPDVDLSAYSNSWWSYAAITARNLDAQLHDVSQGGIALLDGIGWFCGPNYVGQESMWDRIEYNPFLGESKPWDFSRYTPHVVVVAIGQNDANPHDFMANDYEGEQARDWRERYADFARRLRAVYPHALIILTTTVLMHDASWDTAIDDAHAALDDPRIVRFRYSRNGSATPGHPRIAEHEEMARELTAFIESFGEEAWKE